MSVFYYQIKQYWSKSCQAIPIHEFLNMSFFRVQSKVLRSIFKNLMKFDTLNNYLKFIINSATISNWNDILRISEQYRLLISRKNMFIHNKQNNLFAIVIMLNFLNCDSTESSEKVESNWNNFRNNILSPRLLVQI